MEDGAYFVQHRETGCWTIIGVYHSSSGTAFFSQLGDETEYFVSDLDNLFVESSLIPIVPPPEKS
jgi:hypothetical protein